MTDVSFNETAGAGNVMVPYRDYAALFTSPTNAAGSLDSVSVATASPNVWIDLNEGGDAVQVTSGSNIISINQISSNYIVSGTGNDSLFLYVGSGSKVSETVANFHAGGSMTINDSVGWTPGTSSATVYGFTDQAGNPETDLVLDLSGAPGVTDVSLLFTGITPSTFANFNSQVNQDGIPGIQIFADGSTPQHLF